MVYVPNAFHWNLNSFKGLHGEVDDIEETLLNPENLSFFSDRKRYIPFLNVSMTNYVGHFFIYPYAIWDRFDVWYGTIRPLIPRIRLHKN